jgi:hypothetical protein
MREIETGLTGDRLTPLSVAQSEIDGKKVARMIMDFWAEFGLVYGKDTLESSLCAVGPLQAMIGLAIKNGYLEVKE